MYNPLFNSVLVEIDDPEAQYGSSEGSDAPLGKAFHKGIVVKVGAYVPEASYPVWKEFKNENVTYGFDYLSFVKDIIGKKIIWNEGAEAGTMFEHDGKQYGFVYWHDIRGYEAVNE